MTISSDAGHVDEVLRDKLTKINNEIQRQFREENLNMYEGGFNDALRVSSSIVLRHMPKDFKE